MIVTPAFVSAAIYPAQGGTGLLTLPSYGQMLVGTASGTYTLTATSSLGITGTADGTFSTTSADAYIIASSTIVRTPLALAWSLLQTFASGLISQASSTISTLHLGTPLEVASGGTASTTLTGILKGNGTSAVQSAIAGTDYENILTAGDGLTRTANDFDCDTATASVFGCLASADWTTFNNKESALTFNSPLSRSVNAVSFLFNTANTWTAHNIFSSVFGTSASTTNATTTNFAITSLGTPAGTFLAVNPSGVVIATTTSAGGVTSVSGTTNQISSTGGGTPVLSIPSLFVIGQASTTQLSTYTGLYVGATATTTIFGTATSTFGAGIAGTYLNLTGVSATSTFAQGVNLSGGCFAVSGTCIGAGGSGTVTSVGLSDSNSTLTIGGTPITTSGTLTATLNLANSNIWSALQLSSNTGTTTYSGGIESGTKIAAPYFLATSTTATSTFSGGVQFNGAVSGIVGEVVASTTLTAAVATTTLNIPANAGNDLRIMIEIPSLSVASDVQMQLNGDTAGNYGWSGLVNNAAVVSAGSVSNIVLTGGTDESTNGFFFDLIVTNEGGARKIVKWTGARLGAGGAGATASIYNGAGVWNNIAGKITSISVGAGEGGATLAIGTRIIVKRYTNTN